MFSYYTVEYELCALLFLIAITIQFYTKHHFPSRMTSLFYVILWSGIVSLTLDIFGSYLIENALVFPAWANYVINITFYSLQIIFPILLFVYILLLAGLFRYANRVLIGASFLPAAISQILLLTTPVTHIFFFIDEQLGYVYGCWFYYLYAGILFYLSLSAIIIIRFRERFRKNTLTVLAKILIVTLVTVIVQFYHPNLLLTGVGITFAIFLIFNSKQDCENALDVSTGAYSYGCMLDFLNERITDHLSFQLIALEVDGLRQVNSLFGLRAGDHVLSDICSFLRSTSKHTYVFRIMSSRFIVITIDETDYRHTLDNISTRFDLPWRVDCIQMLFSATVRHTCNQDIFTTPEDVVSLVDSAFRDLNKACLGSTAEFSGDVMNSIHRQLTIETSLRKALDSGTGLSLHYQPVYSLKEHRFTSAEALLRFHDDALGEISPNEFIPIAEKCGLIIRIDELVVRFACDFLLRAEPIKTFGLTDIKLNLSAGEFFQDNPLQKLANIVEQCGVMPSHLAFEITESAAAKSFDVLNPCMNKLIRKGFQFILDDYGTGYSNISRVINLPFSTVKLDRSMLVAQETNPNNAIVFKDTLNMFRQLQISTVIEGVETPAQASRIIELDADYVQGHLYAMPMPEDEFISFLAKQDTVPTYNIILGH